MPQLESKDTIQHGIQISPELAQIEGFPKGHYHDVKVDEMFPNEDDIKAKSKLEFLTTLYTGYGGKEGVNRVKQSLVEFLASDKTNRYTADEIIDALEDEDYVEMLYALDSYQEEVEEGTNA